MDQRRVIIRYERNEEVGRGCESDAYSIRIGIRRWCGCYSRRGGGYYPMEDHRVSYDVANHSARFKPCLTNHSARSKPYLAAALTEVAFPQALCIVIHTAIRPLIHRKWT